ncbi:MAG: hypothetical protein QUV07_15330 [Cyanobium sp. CZS 25K]|nr:hypothetical protein [Cyanobium sp. CZS25K]
MALFAMAGLHEGVEQLALEVAAVTAVGIGPLILRELGPGARSDLRSVVGVKYLRGHKGEGLFRGLGELGIQLGDAGQVQQSLGALLIAAGDEGVGVAEIDGEVLKHG